MRPESVKEIVAPHRRQTFLAKIGKAGDASQVQATQPSKADDNTVMQQQFEIDALTEKIKELTEQLTETKEQYSNLERQYHDLANENDLLRQQLASAGAAQNQNYEDPAQYQQNYDNQHQEQ